MTETKREAMNARIQRHGEDLLRIFPNAKDRIPRSLCKKVRQLEAKAHAVSLRACNGPQFQPDEESTLTREILRSLDVLLGNVPQSKTGERCGCKRGQERDNCPACEGTGERINFKAIRDFKRIPIFLNKDARGYALKIDSDWLDEQRSNPNTVHLASIHRDWGGNGIIAPDLSED